MAAPEETMQPGTPTRPVPDFQEDVKPGIVLEAFQRVCQFLVECERCQEFDKLKVKFKQLQKWTQSSMSAYLLHPQFLDILCLIFDKLAVADGKRELETLEELLLLLEDTNEFVQERISGTTECGKRFIPRLLTLAATEVRSVSLHRAAVETLCAMITKSVGNQQMVIDDQVSCLKLFKQQLPSCGDFQLQAGITEVYYRSAILDASLLNLMTESRVREAMDALIKVPKPDLSKIREFVILLNDCMGSCRSVYTFPANKILLNGQNVISSEENLISFGKRNFSFYQMDVDGDGPVVLDVEYESIFHLQSGANSILEMVVEDRNNVLFAQEYPVRGTDVNQDQLAQVRILVYMAPNDYANFKAALLPKLLQLTSKRTGLVNRPSRKSSIGIITPQCKGTTPDPASQSRNGAGHHQNLSDPARGILKKSPMDAGPTSGIAVKTEVVRKDDGSKPTTAPASQKKNSSDELLIVEVTPPIELPATEQGNRRDVQIEVTGENTQDFGAVGPCSRVTKRPNECTNKSQEAYPTGQHKTDKQVSNGRHIPEEKHCDLVQLSSDTTFQDDSTEGALKPREECEKGGSIRFAEKDRKPLSIEEGEASPPAEGSDFKVYKRGQRGPSALYGNVKSTILKDVTDVQRQDLKGGNVSTRTEASDCKLYYQRGTTALREREKLTNSKEATDGQIPEGRQHGQPSLKRKAGAVFEFDVAYSCQTGAKVGRPKRNSNTSAGKNSKNEEKTKCSMPKNAPANDTDAGCPRRAGRHQAIRKHPTRQTSKKIESESSDSQSTSDSDGTSTSDDEWEPKGNVCIINLVETDSDERKTRPRAANGLRTKSVTISDLPLSAQTGNGGPSSAKVQRKSIAKATGIQRKTKRADVHCFISDNQEVVKYTSRNSILREKNPRGTRLTANRRATTLSTATSTEQPGTVRAATGADAFDGVTQEGAAGEEPYDDDVLMSKSLGRHQINLQDEAPKHCRVNRKSTTFSEHMASDLNKISEDSACLPSSSMAAGGKRSIAGQEMNTLDKPEIDAENKCLHLISTMIKDFKKKVRSETDRKMTDIIAQTSQLIQHDLEGMQTRIQKDVAQYGQISKEKYAHLNSKLEGQTKKMRLIYEQFQNDFNEHIQQYEEIIQGIDGAEKELNDMAKRKGQEHKELFERLQETSTRHVAEADEKILSVTKAAEAMYGLKKSLKGVLLREN
ncbi:hypothetical protein R1flu_009604 [Riccia fluitans]|uniref:Meiosis-specific protein ASY3-like coiled-coil domain-containing protein n=1 Tax=Riccia fluitans TaxID=41844 RepID=A0ABD1Z6R9_9MARC